MYKFSAAGMTTALIMLSTNFISSAYADTTAETHQQMVSSSALPSQPSITSPAKRIVVMDFGGLDTLDKLQQSKRVVAFPKNNTPSYLSQYNVENYNNTGGMKEPDITSIAELKPDLIIIGGRQAKSFSQLEAIAPTMKWEMDNSEYLTYFKNNVRQLAHLVGERYAAETVLKDIDKKIADLQTKTAKSATTAVVIMHNNGKLFPVNYSSFAVIVHDIVGIKRADNSPMPQQVEQKKPATTEKSEPTAKPAPRPSIDIGDYLTKYNPDIIFVVDRSAAIKQGQLDNSLLESAKIKETKAYKNNKIIKLTPDLWYLSGAGLESLPMQIDEVAAALK